MLYFLLNFLKKSIYTFFFVLIILFYSSNKLLANEINFIVDNVKIIEKFNLKFSKDKIIEKAFKISFYNLMEKVLISSDFKNLNKVNLNEIEYLIESFKISNEEFKEDKYFATFKVTFNRKKISLFLENKNLFISTPNLIDVFFLPIFINNNKVEMFDSNIFYTKWKSKKKNNYLINYILPIEDIIELENFVKNIDDLEKLDLSILSNKYNLKNYILCLVYKNNDNLIVFSKINFFGDINNFNSNFNNVNLNNEDKVRDYINQMKVSYEDVWKKNNQINTSLNLSLEIHLVSNDFTKIENFENTLSNVDVIKSFSIKTFNLKKNIYEVIYNGNPDKLIEKFLDYGINLSHENQKWIVNE
jgi:hypothetical protein